MHRWSNMLDSSPRNELGKGILDLAEEAKLLAQGYVYARRVFRADGSYFFNLCKTNIAPVATALFLSAAALNQADQINNTLVFNHEQNRKSHYPGA